MTFSTLASLFVSGAVFGAGQRVGWWCVLAVRDHVNERRFQLWLDRHVYPLLLQVSGGLH